MKYMGSKNRIAKEILPIILKDRKPNQWYIEPFVGGANMIDKVDGNRAGFDSNPYLIEALKYIRDNEEKIPLSNSDYSKEMYNIAKTKDIKNISGLDCFALFQYSFGSKFKGGWASNKKGADYVKRGRKYIKKQSKNIQNVYFDTRSFLDLKLTEPCIIYCDPPYAKTTGYKNGYFNHKEYWDWVRDLVKQGHKVFCSEYIAPEDFLCVWEKQINGTLNNSNGKNKKPVEKLFIHNSQL